MGNIFKKFSFLECKCCPKRDSKLSLILNDYYQVTELDTALYKSDDDIISGEIEIFDSIDLSSKT